MPLARAALIRGAHWEGLRMLRLKSGVFVMQASAVLLCGCEAATNVVAQPSGITLDAALTQTVTALYQSRAKALELQNAGYAPAGLNPCTITATFNIAATGTSTGSAGITAGSPAGAPVSVSANLQVTNTATANRGNQVTVVFTTPACNPTGTLGTTAPQNVVLLEREVESARRNLPDPIKWKPGYQAIGGSGGGGSQPGGGAGGGGGHGGAQPSGDMSSLNAAAE